jgi:YYY domain-containing protein
MSPVPADQYFNTETSTLNPHNVGHGFYVYGTLPVIIARLVVQEVYGHSGFSEMTNVGRTLSTIADLFTVLLVYLIGSRLYDRRVGLLGAAFSALAVLQIQQSHFFTTDTFIVVFTVLAIYFSTMIATRSLTPTEEARGTVDPPLPDDSFPEAPLSRPASQTSEFFRSPMLYLSILFGVALGLAVASKINAAPVALALPVAFTARYLSLPKETRSRYLLPYLVYIFIGAFFSLLTFRIAQPYAFAGPGFFNILPNPKWLANMKEVQAGSAGDIDYPFALQWGRRSHLFSGKNMILWGMGIPMGLLAWAGFLWAGWRTIKRGGEWRKHLIPWFWVAMYFTWQSLAFNPTMRYQLPIYPILALFAGWFLVTLWERGRELRKHVHTETGRQVPGTGDQGLGSQTADGGPGTAEELSEQRTAKSEQLKAISQKRRWFECRTLQIGAVLLGILGIGLTAAWAFAFTRIYVRPITRIEASRWIYQNVPGPVNVRIQQADGVYNQPLYYPNGYVLDATLPYNDHFIAQADGVLTSVTIGYLLDQSADPQVTTIRATVSGNVDGQNVIVSAQTAADLTQDSPNRQIIILMEQPLQITTGERYSLTLEVAEPDRSVVMNGPITALVTTETGTINQQLAFPTHVITVSQPFFSGFAADASGKVSEIALKSVVEETGASGADALTVNLLDAATGEILGSGRAEADLSPDPQDVAVLLDRPVELEEGRLYNMQVTLDSQSGQVRVQGTAIANESDFDDALPVRTDGYDAWAGIYPHGVIFQSYWDDNLEKLARYVSIMETADYIVMSSNRQWGTIPRVPERYPMTTIYYRELMGCPLDVDIVTCYTVAQEGMFEGRLGYRLVKVFQSDPSIGPFSVNDQFAEEAFTVYEHPKVLIFQKTEDFEPEQVRDVLSTADFDHIQRLTPKKIPQRPADLEFPSNIFERLKQGGTWSELFNTEAIQNRYPGLAMVVWYLFIFVLGLAVYPFVRIALPGLDDRGYPLARIAGMLILGYLPWVIGSARIPVTRGTIAVVFVILLAAGAFLAYIHRADLRDEWRERRRYFLIVEGLFLLLFLIDIGIRLGNPDLWHPWKGGERPMDFAYFNAVLKSTTFPPYDPWFAGGYINYYYYGFVLVGMPTKLLGIVPSIAFNLIIPTIFSMIAMAAFSLGWNVYIGGKRGEQRKGNSEKGELVDLETGRQVDTDIGIQVEGTGEERKANSEKEQEPDAIPDSQYHRRGLSPYIAGIAGALLMAVLGNLGIVRMIVNGYQMLAAPGGVIANTSIPSRLVWTVDGFFKALSGEALPYGIDAWYWNPSRAIPAQGDIEPITEFPFFTVLYGDPHAHLYAMPVALLAIAFVVSVVASRGRWKSTAGAVSGFLLGALAVGATYPLNLSDIYTYLPLMIIPLAYVLFSYIRTSSWDRRLFPAFLRREIDPGTRRWIIRGLAVLIGVAALVFLSYYLYEPYRFYYAQGYGKVSRWTGPTTPSMSYLVHWGLFLFIFVTWFIYETWDWMASTPLSSLRKLSPYISIILFGIFLALAAIGALVVFRAYIGWIALPLAIWAGLLILRPGQPDMKRLVLFMIGTGLLITIVVELVVVVGDVGRMNTVFKFYLQVWLMYAVSAAAVVCWMLESLRGWRPAWSTVWQIGLAGIVFGASLYPLMASMAKIKDRWNQEAPKTLDGMAFMPYVTYNEAGTDMDIGEDYRMIRWIQENIQGSPVIVEANSRDLYRMYNRVTMYTGLPGVVGWENHQIQQRGVLADNRVPMRIDHVGLFYTTTDLEAAEDFLMRYDVRYIIVGQLERIHYAGDGLGKFPALEGILWKPIYQDGSSVIYEVISR